MDNLKFNISLMKYVDLFNNVLTKREIEEELSSELIQNLRKAFENKLSAKLTPSGLEKAAVSVIVQSKIEGKVKDKILLDIDKASVEDEIEKIYKDRSEIEKEKGRVRRSVKLRCYAWFNYYKMYNSEDTESFTNKVLKHFNKQVEAKDVNDDILSVDIKQLISDIDARFVKEYSLDVRGKEVKIVNEIYDLAWFITESRYDYY